MSSTSVEQVKTRDEKLFVNSLLPQNLAPLWTQMNKMVPPHPNPTAVPASWKYAKVRPSLMKAGEIIDAEEAERRVLMLVNPAMEAPYTTDTIYGGLQLILPGEVAPAHRHIAFALRFIIEGTQGFTAVEGQKMIMERGDVILTPSWHWHDHGNEGLGPVVWLDGLDLPLFKYAPVNFAEIYNEKRYPSEFASQCEWRFPWKDVAASLEAQSGAHRIHHYRSKSGKHLSATLSAQAEMIAAKHTTSSQETCSFIYHCYEGEGQTVVTTPSGQLTKIDWVAKDTFAVPAWSTVQHINKSSMASFLFAINDRPLVESLGLERRRV
ncbi:RmlC-like cupin [Stipitochalara longipes BDJ]|nr:RmlC-like cupin [Stipitochalara longipes BDJ]